MVFFIYIYFLSDSSNSRLSKGGFGLDLMQGITFLKKENSRKALKYRLYKIIEKEKNKESD